MLREYIKPLVIGDITFPTNLIQGPLAGVSCAPFREMVWRFGGVAYCVTEMLSAYAFAHGLEQPKRYTYRSPLEQVLSVQLAASDITVLQKAVEAIVASKTADMIDLNCGCPQPKIRRKNQGSKLLEDPEKLRLLVQAMVQVSDVPITVKVRVDGGSGSAYNVDIMQAIEQAGAQAITVHGRHYTESYDAPCRLDEIAALVPLVSVPVIANGDVHDEVSLQRVFEKTGCAGVMVARAGMGQPWLYAKCHAISQGLDYVLPDVAERKALCWQHINALAALDGEHLAYLQARRWVARYFPQELQHPSWVSLTKQISLPQDLETAFLSLQHESCS